MTRGLTAVVLEGLNAKRVQIEVTSQSGLPAVHVVGLPDAAVRESVERVRAALRACSIAMPRKRVTISLSPAELRKTGSGFDMGIALALMEHMDEIPIPLQSDGFIGELGLHGEVRSVRGILPMVLGMQSLGITRCYVPADDAEYVAHVSGIEVLPVQRLQDLVEALRAKRVIPAAHPNGYDAAHYQNDYIDDLVGLDLPKRVLMISAAGGHNVLFHGPPGTGKTALAKSLVSLLPDMSQEEQVETNSIWSLVGANQSWLTRPPFRNPHHSASAASILGGGTRLMPGELSLAHNGILFLDELPEFKRDVIEQLRQPLEEREVRVVRASQRATYPARVQFIAAANPCVCGYAGDNEKACACTPTAITRYQNKLSGPLMDRIDLAVWVPRASLAKGATHVRKKIQHERAIAKIKNARQRQARRSSNFRSVVCNADLTGTQARELVQIDEATKQLLARAEKRLALSPRGYVRVLKVARTIADLAEREHVLKSDVEEALQYRPMHLRDA